MTPQMSIGVTTQPPTPMTPHPDSKSSCSCNMNTLNIAHQAISWQALMQATLNPEADIICIQETNTNWTTPTILTTSQILNKSNYHASKVVSVSASKDPTENNYQPSGTFTSALGHWTACLKGTGQDSSGMGRCLYLKLHGSNNINYIITLGYQVLGPQQPKLGSNTAFDQQYQVLLSQGNTQPKPCKQFINDLVHQVQQWHQQNFEVLLCLDADKDVENLTPLKDLGQLIAVTNLADTHDTKYPNHPCPAMHQRGIQPIDIILASPQFINAITATYILPFGQPITMPEDHCTLGVDLDPQLLFGNQFPTHQIHTNLRSSIQCNPHCAVLL